MPSPRRSRRYAVPPAPTFAPPQQALAEAAAAPAPLTGRLPPAGRIVYQVLRGGDGFVIGQSEQRWQHDGEHYRLSAETGTTGLAALFKPVKVVLKSRGVFDPQGLRPLEFERWQGERLREQIRFEPEAGKVWLAGQSVEFVPGVQDLLSIFYQLGVLTAATPRFGVAVAAGRKVATYAVTVGAVALLDLPQGARAARAYTIEAGSERTEVWLDADTQLPIKIRHQDKKGELFEQLATLIELE
ncbi:MAG: DUF3108 domain-containing protein [Rhodocyclaceae bacterium]|nr:DUF3108 domain-containing protein [Rhodocyclaceae bacterium]